MAKAPAAAKIPVCLFLPGDSLKMLRETMCVAQQAIPEGPRAAQHRDRIERVIAEIDRQRPLGPDGKHGNLHTLLCGCEGNKKSAV